VVDALTYTSVYGESRVHIALLEDDIDQARVLQLWLEDADHECRWFETGEAFIKGMRADSYDLLILDWMLPDSSGIEILTWVRDNIDWPVPVLFVTSKDSERDIVTALQAGADDYMSKPVKQMEMLARIEALARRSQQNTKSSQIQVFGPYTIDPATRTITRNGEPLELTQKEYILSVFLLNNQGRVLSRGHILEHVWGRSAELNTRTVDTHVSRIRKKLGLSPESGWRLSAIYQYGYRLECLDNSQAPQAMAGQGH